MLGIFDLDAGGSPDLSWYLCLFTLSFGSMTITFFYSFLERLVNLSASVL
jgi:hypothetical protein